LHITQGMYLAKLLGRKPIIHWGKESLYNNTSHEDVFKDFFNCDELNLSIKQNFKDVFPCQYSEFPYQYLLKEKYDTTESSVLAYLQSLLKSNCELVVYDRFLNLGHLLPLLNIKKEKFSYPEFRYKELVKKYHKPCDLILNKVKNEMESMGLEKGNFNAIQLRLSEKVRTQENYSKVLSGYYNYFEVSTDDMNKDLFICSEDQKAIDYFSEKYPGRVLSSSASRNVYKFDKSASKLGIVDNQYVPEFLLKTPGLEKKWMGFEVVTDVLLASYANVFVGSDSNVAKIIAYLLDDCATNFVFSADEVISADKMKEQ